MKKLLFIPIFLFTFYTGKSQADTIGNGFTLGLEFGYYFGNSESARYYNGDGKGNNRLQPILENPVQRNRVREKFNGDDFRYLGPADMDYRPSFAFGLDIGYHFGKRQEWSVNLNFWNVKLEATGAFNIEIQRQIQGTNELPLEQIGILGTETRSHLQLGVEKQMDIGSGFFVPFEGGLNLNFVEVKENFFTVDGTKFPLQTRVNQNVGPTGQQSVNTGDITTVGAGFYLASGIMYRLPSYISISLNLNYISTSVDANQVVKDESVSVFIPSFGFRKVF